MIREYKTKRVRPPNRPNSVQRREPLSRLRRRPPSPAVLRYAARVAAAEQQRTAAKALFIAAAK